MSKIVIIGCGIVGAAIAYELSLVAGLDITVVEQHTPASGSTGAALGVLMGVISQKKKGRAWRLRQTSLKRYQTLIPELQAITGLSIPVNRQGVLKLLFEGDNFEQWQKLQAFRALEGWELIIGDRAYLNQQCPHLLNDQIIGAVYSPNDLQVNPVKLTEALVAAATLNGVKFYFHSTVINCLTHSQDNGLSCNKIETTQGEIAVDQLVISAGLGSTPLTQFLQQTIPIVPVLGQAIRFKLNQPLGKSDFQPVITGNDIHIVPLGNQEYWLGATVEFPIPTAETIADPQLLEQVKQGAIAFCPQLKDATILETWSGKRPRPDGISAPIIGTLPGYSNVLLATAHYRNGVLLAPATALDIVSMIRGNLNC
ncbi:FAD dependent oxidoreductase [Chondrocystis sp. NIES-4102]|nr:FAD dependent oxidoreductase [Chondrocystis sp. NIES-4102]